MPATPNKPVKTLPMGSLPFVGLPFLAAGIFFSHLYFSTLTQWWRGRSWVEVPCRIESVDLEARPKGAARATASYRYRHAGRDYTGDRVSFWGAGDNIGSFQRDAFRELSRNKGKTFRCFVDPAQPSQSVIYRTLRWEMLAVMSLFALIFSAIGGGLVVGGLIGWVGARKEARRRAHAPDEPWKWKAAWAEPAIPEDAPGWKAALHACTIWAGLVVFSMIGAMIADGAFRHPASWLALAFPALWCLPAWFSLKRLRHLLAVGRTRFELPARPLHPGGKLEGHLLLPRPLPARGDVEFTLACEKSFIQGNGKNRRTVTETVWSRTTPVPADRVVRDLSGFRLPVSIAIPRDAPESSRNATDQPKLAWKLEFAVPGTAIRTLFLIPVFQTGTPADLAATPALRMEETIHADLAGRLAGSKIRADFSADGLPQSVICPPARYLWPILLPLMIGVVWTLMTVGIVGKTAPPLIALGFLGVGAALWGSVIWMAVHRRTVDFSATGLEVRRRFGPFRWGGHFPKSGILRFSHDSHMTYGNRS